LLLFRKLKPGRDSLLIRCLKRGYLAQLGLCLR
jgi:hypothetical protein